MKMRKLFSAIVAGAIAVSAMMVSASAAVTYQVSDSTAYKVTKFEGTIDFVQIQIPNGSTGKISTGWWNGADLSAAYNAWKADADVNLVVKSAKINGRDLRETHGAEDWFNPFHDYNVATQPTSRDIAWKMQGGFDTLSAGKYDSVTVSIEAYVKNADGTINTDACEELASDFGSWLSCNVNLDVYGGNGIYIGSSETDYLPTTTFSGSVGRSGSYESTDSVEATAGTYKLADSRPTLAEQAVLKGSSGVLTLTLKGVTAMGFASVKVDKNDTIYVPVQKGATTVSIVIPSEQIYDPAYGSLFGGFTYASTAGTITNATITFDDGSAPIAADGTEAAGDDDAAAEDGDDDASDLSDDDDDDDDDIFGDDDDDDDDDFVTDGGSATVGDDTANDGTVATGDTSTATSNPKTGVAVAVIPAIVAAAAVVVARKRK